MKVSILVPFYNEEEMIEKMHQVLSDYVNQLSDYDFEFVYIDDGSNDQTLPLMRSIARADSRVRYYSFSRNFGKEAGLLAGLDHMTGDCVIIMDGDLQNPPYLIQPMLEKFQEGYDLVSAKRNRKGEKAITTFFAHSFYKVANHMMEVHLKDGVSDFRLLSRRAVEAIRRMPEYNRFSKGIFAWIGFKEAVVEYDNELREAGTTKWSFRSSLNYALDGILSFSNQPLRLIFGLGLFCIGLFILYILYLFVMYFVNKDQTVSGYFTTIFTIVFFGGVQLVSIGILGEYIGKIFSEVKRRPHYIIQETNVEEEK